MFGKTKLWILIYLKKQHRNYKKITGKITALKKSANNNIVIEDKYIFEFK